MHTYLGEFTLSISQHTDLEQMNGTEWNKCLVHLACKTALPKGFSDVHLSLYHIKIAILPGRLQMWLTYNMLFYLQMRAVQAITSSDQYHQANSAPLFTKLHM